MVCTFCCFVAGGNGPSGSLDVGGMLWVSPVHSCAVAKCQREKGEVELLHNFFFWYLKGCDEWKNCIHCAYN